MKNAARQTKLSREVRDVLNFVMRKSTFPGSKILARQIHNLTVRAGPITMLELDVGHSAPAIAVADGPIPTTVEVSDELGHSIGELLIWVDHGFLSTLELAWWTDHPPEQIPNPRRLRIIRG